MVDFELIHVQSVLATAATLSFVIGVINYIFTSRRRQEQRETELETRQAALFMQIYNRWTQRDFIKAYGKMRYKYEWKNFDDFTRKYWPTKDSEAWSDMGTVLYYLEGLGVLVQRGLIDIGILADLMSNRVIVLWEKMESIIKESRIKQKAPKYHDHFEYLYNELKRRQTEI